MVWEPETEELHIREALAAHMGGEERVERHHAAGKLTVRERIAALVDSGSFHEIGATAGFAEYDEDGHLESFRPTNMVMGEAFVDGRPVMIAGDDFTVRGGAADASIWKKFVLAESRARKLRIPIVRLVDGSGGGGSVKSYLDLGRTYVPPLPGWADQVAALNEIPVVAAALGSVAGLGAARVVNSHFSVMVEDTSQIFTAGPPVVAYATREDVGKQELGGADAQTANGNVDNLAATEPDAFHQIRWFLTYLPRSVWEMPPRINPEDDPGRRDESLLSIIPRDRRRVYDARALLGAIVDRGSFFEIGANWGKGTIVGLARLDGVPVGVLASDPGEWGGVLTADGSDKLRRFVHMCDTFHLPIVNFVDQPGLAVGTVAEAAATLRHGVSAIAALYQIRVPYFTVIVRRAFGIAGAAMVDCAEPHLRVAWPSGDWGSLPLEGGVEAAYKRALAEADDPDALRRELLEKFEAVRSPFRTAEAFDIEEIIDPRDTRPLLCRWIRIVYPTLAHDLGPRARGYLP